jgi:GGDEF domain-containing protein
MRKVGALISMPVVWKTEVCAVIAFVSRSEAHWSKEEIGAISAVVRRASLVLQNFSLRRELALVRNLDPVTEVCNIEAFDRALNKRLARCQEAGATLGLGIISIEGLEELSSKVALPDLSPLRQRLAAAILQRLEGRQLMGSLDAWCFAVLCENDTPGDLRARLTEITTALQRELSAQVDELPRLRARFGFGLYPQDAVAPQQLWTAAFRALADHTSALQREAASGT